MTPRGPWNVWGWGWVTGESHGKHEPRPNKDAGEATRRLVASDVKMDSGPFCKGPGSKGFRLCGPYSLSRLLYSAARHNTYTDGQRCVPIKLYLQKQSLGQVSPWPPSVEPWIVKKRRVRSSGFRSGVVMVRMGPRVQPG